MTSPADTIREALTSMRDTGDRPWFNDEAAAALAALTELEQQAAAAKVREDRLALGVVAKSNELARAEADRDRLQADRDSARMAAENYLRSYELCLADRDRLADTLRKVVVEFENTGEITDSSADDGDMMEQARAALDRHTKDTEEAK